MRFCPFSLLATWLTNCHLNFFVSFMRKKLFESSSQFNKVLRIETYLFLLKVLYFSRLSVSCFIALAMYQTNKQSFVVCVPHWPKIMIIKYLFNSSMILEELISFVCFSEVDFSRNKNYRWGRQNESTVWQKGVKKKCLGMTPIFFESTV